MRVTERDSIQTTLVQLYELLNAVRPDGIYRRQGAPAHRIVSAGSGTVDLAQLTARDVLGMARGAAYHTARGWTERAGRIFDELRDRAWTWADAQNRHCLGIPNQLAIPELSPRQQLALSHVVTAYRNGRIGVSLSYEEFGAVLACSRATVARTLAALRDAGWLRWFDTWAAPGEGRTGKRERRRNLYVPGLRLFDALGGPEAMLAGCPVRDPSATPEQTREAGRARQAAAAAGRQLARIARKAAVTVAWARQRGPAPEAEAPSDDAAAGCSGAAPGPAAPVAGSSKRSPDDGAASAKSAPFQSLKMTPHTSGSAEDRNREKGEARGLAASGRRPDAPPATPAAAPASGERFDEPATGAAGPGAAPEHPATRDRAPTRAQSIGAARGGADDAPTPAWFAAILATTRPRSEAPRGAPRGGTASLRREPERRPSAGADAAAELRSVLAGMASRLGFSPGVLEGETPDDD